MSDSPARRHAKSSVSDEGPDEADSYEALRRRLADGLVMLRAEFREAVESYAVQVQGMVTRAADAIEEDPTPPSPSQRRARARIMRQALKDLDDLDVKPARGRRKDLKRIEKYVAELGDAIAEW